MIKPLSCFFRTASAVLLAMPFAALAANVYVAASGTYDGLPAYTDLQAAVNASASGDTVWVEDGFVCYTGRTAQAENACRLLINKAVTVRSRSGGLGNPAVIRGEWHDPSGGVALGVNAVRCVRMSSTNARLIGFRLEDGATAAGTDWTATAVSGGGFLGVGVLSNCLITANSAGSGGGVSGAGGNVSLYNCVISNNTATLSAGGIKAANCFSTAIVDNRSDGDSGGLRTITATDCLIAGNRAALSGGGGIAVSTSFTDCVITNNEAGTSGGGLQYTPTLIRCLVGWNRAATEGGGVCGAAATVPARAFDSTFSNNRAGGSGGGARHVVASNCTFVGNFSGGTGGGASGVALTDCTVTDNVASNSTWGNGCGGGFAEGALTNCLVASNHARGGVTVNAGTGTGGGVYGSSTRVVSCVVSNNTSDSRGGGMHLCIGYNNLVIDNRAGSNGGGVCGGSQYNSLIFRNFTTGPGGGAGYQTALYNCTVLENVAATRGGVETCWLVNTVTWGNVGTADMVTTATNSCGLACTADKGPGNSTSDPRIATSGPDSFLPAPGSPCRNSGLALTWMTDPADIRSRDRNGSRRVIGSSVDMGAFETLFNGTFMTVR